MNSSEAKSIDVVFVGGGHANLQAIRMLAMSKLRGVRLTLINDNYYAPYSGMLPGHLAGFYSFDECHFDLSRICAQLGATFILGSVQRVCSKKNELHLPSQKISFDYLSINVGIQPQIMDSTHSNLLPLKPIGDFLKKWNDFTKSMKKSKSQDIVFIGGGAAGVELSLITAQKLQQIGNSSRITLIQSSKEILPTHGTFAQRHFQKKLKKEGIQVLTSNPVTRIESNHVELKGGKKIPAHWVFLATHAAPPKWFEECDLPLSSGYLSTNSFLQIPNNSNIFAAGDCIQFDGHNLPKSGVFAVRQGPILGKNIIRSILGKGLLKYKPQKLSLAILRSGHKKASALYLNFIVSGSLIWKLKNYIDTKFMKSFGAHKSKKLNAEELSALCGGCGSKIGPTSLNKVLKNSPNPVIHEDLVSIKNNSSPPSFLNIDVITECVSDLFTFAKIGFLHSANDFYLKGLKPSASLLWLGVKNNSNLLQQRDLKSMYEGALNQAELEGSNILGGHSSITDKTSFGCVLYGSDSTPMIPKSSPQPGDQMVLTKPLGSGALLRAHMLGRLPGHSFQNLINHLLVSNRTLSDILRKYNISSATDISGFGFLGHLVEVLGSSPFGAQLCLSNIPILPGFLKCFQKGVMSSIHKQNAEFALTHLGPFNQCRLTLEALFDPQTNGPGLILIQKNELNSFLNDLNSQGYIEAKVVGEITPTFSRSRVSLVE